MTSERDCYVWIWLPGATEPVVAGRLIPGAGTTDFVYGRSYLERPDAIPLFDELPLHPGRIRPIGNLTVAGCIRDAGPDAWGQRVIAHRLLNVRGRGIDVDALSLITYLLESGSDRVGALDFQVSPHTYVHRDSGGTLDELVNAAAMFLADEDLSPDMEHALGAGSTIGGARPKVALDHDGHKLIAKFSVPSDPYPVVKAEGVAMELARRVGVAVARAEVVTAAGRDVLLVERFDRDPDGQRLPMVSAMTVLGVDEWGAIHSGYWEIADAIRGRFTDPDATLRELFSRIVFNICVGNTDDHARNHAAFWDGEMLTLTPAYDICPQLRAGQEANQALEIRPGWKLSQLAGCIDAAAIYHLSRDAARDIIERQLDVITTEWADTADAARLTSTERDALWSRQVLNPFALYGWPPA